jgi:hypothetical protein
MVLLCAVRAASCCLKASYPTAAIWRSLMGENLFCFPGDTQWNVAWKARNETIYQRLTLSPIIGKRNHWPA